MLSDEDKLSIILDHKSSVKKYCCRIAVEMMEEGRSHEARILVANSCLHDNSKLEGIEWEHLWPNNPNKEALKLALNHHNTTNFHHPQAWASIHNMPEIFLAELASDWKTRSSEFGTDLMDWIDSEATKRFKFKKNDKVYERIVYFVGLLLDKPFVAIPEEKEKIKK